MYLFSERPRLQPRGKSVKRPLAGKFLSSLLFKLFSFYEFVLMETLDIISIMKATIAK